MRSFETFFLDFSDFCIFKINSGTFKAAKSAGRKTPKRRKAANSPSKRKGF